MPIPSKPIAEHAPPPEQPSRRAVLAAAAGAAAAVVTAMARPARADAAAGSALIIGSSSNNAGTSDTQLLTNSGVVAFKLLQNGPGTALMGYATPTSGGTRGVYGRTDSPNGDGVQARNAATTAGGGAAIHAYGGNNRAIVAETAGLDNTTIDATNTSGGTATRAIRAHSMNGIGVDASSTNGIGCFASSASTYAGWFANEVKVEGYLDIEEIAAPAAPGTDVARLFVRDNGAGKTQLCIRFGSGSVQVIAAQV